MHKHIKLHTQREKENTDIIRKESMRIRHKVYVLTMYAVSLSPPSQTMASIYKPYPARASTIRLTPHTVVMRLRMTPTAWKQDVMAMRDLAVMLKKQCGGHGGL